MATSRSTTLDNISIYTSFLMYSKPSFWDVEGQGYIQGLTAEWIVERPQVPSLTAAEVLGALYAYLPPFASGFSSLEPLARFGEVLFTNAACGTVSGFGRLPGIPSYTRAGSLVGAGVVPLQQPDAAGSNTETSFMVDSDGEIVVSGEVLFPGLSGMNAVRVFYQG
jgi:hypothetical protein